MSSQACLFLNTKKSSLLQLFALWMKTNPSGFISLEYDMHACTTNLTILFYSSPQKNRKRKKICSLLGLIFVPSSIRDTSEIWIKLMKPCQYYESRSTHLEWERNKQKERTNMQPREHHSKVQTHEQRLQINPFALKFNKLELVQLPRETMCTFSTDAFLQPLEFFFFFFFFSFGSILWCI